MLDVSIRLFARFRERAGAESVSIELPAGATVANLRERLLRLWPDAVGLLQASAVAVNEEYAAADYVIQPGDDLALIPPVSGG